MPRFFSFPPHIDAWLFYHLWKKLYLFHSIAFSPLSKNSWLYLHRPICSLSSLFHWSICLLFHRYDSVLITEALWEALQVELCLPLTLFFFNVELDIPSFVPHHVRFRICPDTHQITAGILTNIALNL